MLGQASYMDILNTSLDQGVKNIEWIGYSLIKVQTDSAWNVLVVSELLESLKGFIFYIG